MAAMAACMFNPEMSAFHGRLRERGKPRKVALVAVMRDRRMGEDRTASAAGRGPDGDRLWKIARRRPRNRPENPDPGLTRNREAVRVKTDTEIPQRARPSTFQASL